MNLSDLNGHWTGSNLLRLSWLTPSEFVSASQLSASTVAQGHALLLTYTWHHEQVPHAGVLLIVPDATTDRLTGGWVDSWHQKTHVMALTGALRQDRAWGLTGAYPAPPGPDWGWRIELMGSESELTMTMYNLTPAGEDDLAVRAEYRKA